MWQLAILSSMICFLKGRIDYVGADSLAIDVNGVGYQVLASGRTLSRVQVDDVVKIHIYTHVREDAFTLFGFMEESEKQTFELITQVSGVGPKVGLGILSTLSPQEIIEAIQLQSGKTMTRANGVGPKLGERIVRELKDKVGSMALTSGAGAIDGALVQASPTGAAVDVISALANLGYKEQDATKAVQKAVKSDTPATFDNLFKAALKELG